MKKRIVLISVLLLFSMTLSACSFGSSGIVEKIESLVSEYAENENTPNGNSDPSGNTDLNGGIDKNGNITEMLDANTEKMSHYTKDGKLVFYHITTYDDNGRVIHKTAYANGGTTEDGSYDYVYAPDGKLLEGAWFVWDSGYLMKTERFYDENGLCYDEYWHGSTAHNFSGNRHYYFYRDDGKLDYEYYYSSWNEDGYHSDPWTITYSFNEFGKLSRKVVTTQEGALLYYEIHSYNDKGLETEYTSYNPDDSIDFRYEYEYDSNDKKICERRYNGNGTLVSEDRF